jgi:hypothetical protein
MTKPLANPITFTGQSPPWSLTQLDANFAAFQAAINDTLTYSNYFVDQSGVANSVILSISPSLAVGLIAGTALTVKIANTNTGATTITVNALIAQNIVHGDGSALFPNELVAGAIAILLYDGTNFQFLGGYAGAFSTKTNNTAAIGTLGAALLKVGICVGTEGGWTSNPAASNWSVIYPYISSFNGRSGAAPAGIWACNPIAECKVGNDVATFPLEVDLNNDASNVADPGTSLHKNGIASISGGTQNGTAAYIATSRLTNGTAWWNHCYYGERAVTYGVWMRQPVGDSQNAFAGAAFFDQSNSVTSFLVNSGTHVYAIDLNGGTYSAQAMRLPNNSGIVARNAAGNTDYLLLSLNAQNNLVLNSTNSSNILVNSNMLANVDNSYTCGGSGFRWSAVWAANGSIQTSDPKLKTNIQDLPPMAGLVASLNPKTFQWKVGGHELVETEEEQEVQATEDITEEYEEVELVSGVPTFFKKTRIKLKPLFDVLPVLDDAGQPVMHTELVRLPDANGTLVLQERTIPRVHHVPRMIKKKMPIKKPVERPGKRTHWGFLATEVRDEFAKLGTDFGGYVLAEDGTHHLRPDQLIPVLWKAVQELQAEVAQLKAKIL